MDVRTLRPEPLRFVEQLERSAVALAPKLDSMDAATCLDDLRNPPGNHLHTLQGRDYEGCWAISVNGPWRLVFQFEGGDIYDVRLVQYH